MKTKLGQLLLWYAIFHFFFHSFREFCQTLSFDKAFWSSKLYFVLMITAFISFFVYALGTYLALHRLYDTKNRKLLFIVIPFIITLGISTRYLLEEVLLLHLFGFTNYNINTSLHHYFFDNLYFGTLYTFLGFIFYFNQLSKYQLEQKQALKLVNQETELALLKSQFNPHFLFNTLNNIYSLIFQKSEHALPAVQKLSGLLRYSLYEAEDQVDLQDEIDHLEDFIELQVMRYDYDLEMDVNFTEDTTGIKIPPFLFIPFVENAFKHGNLKKEKQPLFMELKVVNKRLHFLIKNAIATHQQKDQQGGIGLENVKKRLELLYPNNHELVIKKQDGLFSVILELPL